MLNLVTGTPGSGKTLFVVNELSKVTDRTIYYDGVPLTSGKLPWIPIDAHDWAAVPDGSIVVVDEAQRVWGVRDPKKPVPPDVTAMETHRHRGIDIWVITQHPKMLDHHLRRLVNRHVHLRRNFGLPSSLMLDGNEVFDDPQNVDPAVQRTQFLFPKSTYELYKSAEIHTHKFRPTAKMVAMLVLVLLSFGAIGYAAYRITSGGLMGDKPAPQATPTGEGTREAASPVAPPLPLPPSSTPYLDSLRPESPVVPESAPIYAPHRQVVNVPYLAGCITFMRDGVEHCDCYTQTGSKLGTSAAECHAYLRNPPHVYWAASPGPVPGASASDESVSAPPRPEDESVP
jgi:zona occludens toxin